MSPAYKGTIRLEGPEPLSLTPATLEATKSETVFINSFVHCKSGGRVVKNNPFESEGTSANPTKSTNAFQIKSARVIRCVRAEHIKPPVPDVHMRQSRRSPARLDASWAGGAL
ncbi:hypothetical protein EVAR_60460_1 [Eumeta japonica]|uniref:Uncharacterized protein n=1 Tax=Eumeta variegata TaxID=151549 RepID=A0A4C1Z3L7_EUMVA|nr:hypothetical protein EVAR_60460_1 [Eumeta japonica]